MNYRELVYKAFLKMGYKGLSTNGSNRFSVEKDILRIDIVNGKEKADGLFEVTLVYKEEMQNGNFEEIDREPVTLSIRTLQYLVGQLDSYIVERFCLKQTRKSETQVDLELEKIAKKYLGVETLKTRNSDSLDFYDVAVWNMEMALKKAFELGLKYKE